MDSFKEITAEESFEISGGIDPVTVGVVVVVVAFIVGAAHGCTEGKRDED